MPQNQINPTPSLRASIGHLNCPGDRGTVHCHDQVATGAGLFSWTRLCGATGQEELLLHSPAGRNRWMPVEGRPFQIEAETSTWGE